MEGATLSGRQAAFYICEAGSRLGGLLAKMQSLETADQEMVLEKAEKLSLV